MLSFRFLDDATCHLLSFPGKVRQEIVGGTSGPHTRVFGRSILIYLAGCGRACICQNLLICFKEHREGLPFGAWETGVQGQNIWNNHSVSVVYGLGLRNLIIHPHSH